MQKENVNVGNKPRVVIPEGRNRGSSTHLSLRNETTNDKRGRFPSPRRTGKLGNDALFLRQVSPALQTAKQGSGFTLIELLVVVLIIGILAAVALPQYQRTVDKAAISCIMPVLKTLTDAQTAAALAQGGYPSGYFTFDELDVDIAVPNDSCKSSDICHGFKCAGKEFSLVLRKDQTWANFVFWASPLERLFYFGGQNPHYLLQCKSNRCKQVARAFKARHVGNEESWEYYSW